MKNTLLIKRWEHIQLRDKFFDDQFYKRIILESDSKITYLLLCRGSSIDLCFDSSWEWVTSEIYAIFFSRDKEEISGTLRVNLNHSFSKTDVYMLSLMGENAVIKVAGSIDIWKWIKSVSGHLLEENVVLWENIRVNTLPILNVASNDVSASHGARIQKMDSEKLFYMMSKWLSNDQSKKIVIQWYLEYVLSKFDLSHDQKLEIQLDILNYLLKYDR
jgi:Fe-S cluster assembly protein SufB